MLQNGEFKKVAVKASGAGVRNAPSLRVQRFFVSFDAFGLLYLTFEEADA